MPILPQSPVHLLKDIHTDCNFPAVAQQLQLKSKTEVDDMIREVTIADSPKKKRTWI